MKLSVDLWWFCGYFSHVEPVTVQRLAFDFPNMLHTELFQHSFKTGHMLCMDKLLLMFFSSIFLLCGTQFL